MRTPPSRHRLVTLCLASLFIALPSISAADSGVSNRDILFRFSAGPSYATAFDNYYHGLGADMSVAFGGFVKQTFALHVSLLVSDLFQASHEGRDINHDIYLFAAGVGGTYYAKYSGVYGSFTLMAGSQKITEHSGSSGAWAAELLVGKEWGEGKVGYGIAVGGIAAIDNEGYGDQQISGGGSVRFSMTVR